MYNNLNYLYKWKKIDKQTILDTIQSMSVLDILKGPIPESMEEQTEFDITITSVGGNKVAVIKVVRAATGLDLKEAKTLVESTPAVIKEAIRLDEANSLKKNLEEVGAQVVIS